MSSNRRRGIVIVYTGNGKGKTTAALGLVWRALGRQRRVAVVQFLKGKWTTGEQRFARSLPQLEFHTMGRGFTWESKDVALDRQAAAEAWSKSRELILSGNYFAVVLDELTHALQQGFIAPAEVLQTLRERPPSVNVVITGRGAPAELIDLADLVTEMQCVKHPFDAGLKAQAGIDF